MACDGARIRVLFVIDHIYELTGGTEKQLEKLINNLNHDKYDLNLLCLNETPWFRKNHQKLRCTTQAYHYNVFDHKDLRNLFEVFRIISYMRRLSPDVVVCFFKTSYILGVLCARLAGVSTVITTRRDYGLWLDRRYVHLLKVANRMVAFIVTNSSRVRDLVVDEEEFDRERVIVIYNGIENGGMPLCADEASQFRKRLGIPPVNKVVGIVAGLRPMKRHDTFLKAAKRVLEVRDDVAFVIVGDGPLRADLENFARDLNIASSVHFLGWRQDVRALLSMFDVGVNCSANEGLSNAIMEYMAYEVPCVASKAGGNTELIEDGVNGYTFELDNEKQLAELVLKLLDGPERRDAFVRASKEVIVKKFGVQRMVREYDRLFQEVISGSLGDPLGRKGSGRDYRLSEKSSFRSSCLIQGTT